MGTARTSPKVVRERRAKGIRSNRGHVRRHFPKAHRNNRGLEAVARDAKAWTPAGNDPLEDAATRVMAGVEIPTALRDEVTQEVWVQLLEGRSEEAVQESLSAVVKKAKELEWGGKNLSLDAPMSASGDGAMTIGDFVDTEGRYHRTQARATPKKPMDRCLCGRPCSPDALRCRSCVGLEATERRADLQERRILRAEQWELNRKIRRSELAELRAVYEARRAAFFADRTCSCGGYKAKSAARCLDCWRRDSRRKQLRVVA